MKTPPFHQEFQKNLVQTHKIVQIQREFLNFQEIFSNFQKKQANFLEIPHRSLNFFYFLPLHPVFYAFLREKQYPSCIVNWNFVRSTYIFPFPSSPSVFSVFRQREGKSSEKTGRGQSIGKNPKTIPPVAWATGRGGSSPGFQQDVASGAQDSTRKNFAWEFLSSCSVRLVSALFDWRKNVSEMLKNFRYSVKFT
ncbi:hypothetical protein [Flavonifractor porci]|uniref:hypothetical protein n=1 Tax=Flavonifractor porci TaxID=3133422 RepID=UPI0030AFCB30